MKKTKKNKDQKIGKNHMMGYAPILCLLLGSSFSIVTEKSKEHQSPQKLSVTYQTDVNVIGGGSLQATDNSPKIPTPKDGSFPALYQFSELITEDSASVTGLTQK